MKELELKEQELRQERVLLESDIETVKQEIEYCKEHELDYLSYELLLNKMMDHKKELSLKITILCDAQDVLNGIGM